VSHLNSDWHLLLLRRLAVLCGPSRHRSSNNISPVLESRLSALRPNSAFVVIKTLCNTWCTSHRYHSDAGMRCVFGCSVLGPVFSSRTSRVTLSHYLVCPILWRLLEGLCSQPVGLSALDKLGCTNVRTNLRMLVVAHSVYHYCKFQSCTVCSHSYYTEVSRKFDLFISAANVAIADYID